MLNTITLSNVEYSIFKKRQFKHIKSKYFYEDKFESMDNDYIEYQPFDIPDLYIEFSEIDSSNRYEIIDFINEYGNIGVFNENARPYFEEWEYWHSEIEKMKESIMLLDFHNSENIHYAIECKYSDLFELKNTELYKHITQNSNGLPTVKAFLGMKKMSSFDLRIACLLDLQRTFKSKIGTLSFNPLIGIDADEKPCFKARIEFPSLLHVMYWQLYMKYIENEKHFICEGCNRTFPWFNHKKNFLCNECYDRHNYKRQMSDIKTKAHRNFMNKSGYYTSYENPHPFIDEDSRDELYILREKIQEKSLEVKEDMGDDEYLDWIKSKEAIFMNRVKKYKKGGK